MLPYHAVLPPASRDARGEARDLTTPFRVTLDPRAAAQKPPHPSNNSRALPALGMYTELAHLPNKKQKKSPLLFTRKAGHKPTREWVLPLTPLAGTPCRAGSHLGLRAVARGWEGMVRREEGQPGRVPPTRSVPLLRLRASVGGTNYPHQSSDKGRKYSHYSQKGGRRGRGEEEGRAKRINKGREAQKHCLLKTTTPAYRRYVDLPQPGAEGPWRRNGGPFPLPSITSSWLCRQPGCTALLYPPPL